MNVIKTILLALIILGATNLSAQKSNSKPGKKRTAKFINKTNRILLATGNKVHKHKVYTGYLAKAKKHQRKAITFYNKNNTRKAVRQSYKARRLAFLAFKANKGKIQKKWRLNDKEKKMLKNIVPKPKADDELKKEVTDDEKNNETNNATDKTGLDNIEEKDNAKGKTNGRK